MKLWCTFWIATFLLSAAPLAAANESIPHAGLRAEGLGDWPAAIEEYEHALLLDPQNSELWIRIANIHVRLKNSVAAADTLERATQYIEDDPNLFFRLSQTQASVDQRQAALAAVDRAVQLDPDNTEYLRSRAILANWNADYATSQDSYRRILSVAPGDLEALLGLARSSKWQNDFENAARAYDLYLQVRPDDEQVLLEYIELEAQRGNYASALKLAQDHQVQFIENVDYWLKMATIYAASSANHEADQALNKAASLAPNDADLHYQLSQRYTSSDAPTLALAAIDRAVELEPENLEYLGVRAFTSSWAGDYATALDSYNRILAIAPDDPGALLGVARVNYWNSDSNAAIDGYRKYLTEHPTVHAAWIEYVKIESEHGNYAAAMKQLTAYQERFGQTPEYWKLRARILAWAERPTESLAIVADLESDNPDDYELNYTRTVALTRAHRPRNAVDSLATLTRLQPDSKYTSHIQRFVKTPLRSHMDVFTEYRDDSDDISNELVGIELAHFLNPETSVWLSADIRSLDAPISSGLDNIDGNGDARYRRSMIGVRHMMSSKWSLGAKAGNGSIENGADKFIYEVSSEIWPRDELSLRLSRTQDIFTVSPRAVSLAIQRRANQLSGSWSVDLRHTLDGALGFDTFSDGNERWNVSIAPRRSLRRGQHLNLDLGVGAFWFGFSEDPGNGYYAPNQYQRYAVTGFATWKLNDDNSINLVLSSGPYKDDTMESFDMAVDVVADGHFGIYRDWMLRVSAAYSNNTRSVTGAFESWAVNATIVRRF